MAKAFLTPIDLNKNELQNARIQNLASAPSTPVAGQVYYDTVANCSYEWNGTGWISRDAAKVANGAIALAKLASDPLARANHTGTQAASTILDLETVVKAYKVSDFAAATANIPMGGFTLTGLNTGPSASGQAAEYSWVVGQIQASAAGIDSKPSCIAIAVANQATLTGLAQTIDGIALSTIGMRVLLQNQTTTSQNGPWVVQSGAWIRPVGESVTPQAFYFIEQGTTYGGTQWKVSTTGTIVLDTTPLTIVQFGAGGTYTAGNGLQLIGQAFSVLLPASSGLATSGAGTQIDTAIVVRKFAANIGDGASLAYVVSHNLSTLDVTVGVFRNSGSYDEVGVDIEHTSTNSVTIRFAVAPASNAFRVVVHG